MVKESKKKTSGKKKLMVLIVSYNAEQTITKLLHRIPQEVWDKAEEIVIADDASRDRTAEMARDYKKIYGKENLTVIKHEKNKGYGGNQKWGYKYGMQKGYDIAVMVHGDAQYPPEKIMELIKPIEEGKADFMFGSRMSGDPLGGRMPLYKFCGNIFLTTVENFVLRTDLTEFHSGFRAYSLKALKDIPLDLDSDGFHFDSEIIIQLVIAKKNIGEITIPTFYGDEKCNVKVINYGMNILKELCRYLASKWNIKQYPKYDLKNFK
ncbi:MAG: glycosyltransferase family 2 protein [Nanoarchaeota archaeon]